MSSTDKIVFQGKLKCWNDSKGFGFIYTDNKDYDIFIHISELKHMMRRPAIGDLITYQMSTQGDGRKRAVNAHVKGIRNCRVRSPRKPFKLTKNTYRVIFVTVAVIVVITLIWTINYPHLPHSSFFKLIPF